MGVSLARKAGLIVTLISGEDSPLVDRFAAKMNITDITKGCKDKAAALRAFAERHSLALDEICFMGDDVNDLAAHGNGRLGRRAGRCAAGRAQQADYRDRSQAEATARSANWWTAARRTALDAVNESNA